MFTNEGAKKLTVSVSKPVGLDLDMTPLKQNHLSVALSIQDFRASSGSIQDLCDKTERSSSEGMKMLR